MLLGAIVGAFITNVLCTESTESVRTVKPYVFPVPLEMPNRNDRAEQCWIRIEDVEVVETVTAYCHMAHAFLGNYIHDYNSRMMIEDGVDVSLWSEKPRNHEEDILPPDNSQHEIKDWRVTTILDPITHMRLYVSKNADCRLIIYTRDGMTNYKVDCERILYYFNVRMSGSVFSRDVNIGLIVACVFLLFFRI